MKRVPGFDMLLTFALTTLGLSSALPTRSIAASWILTGSLNTARSGHTATLLSNGKVLVVGGSGNGTKYLADAEIYNPATGTWTNTGALNIPRNSHTATLLSNGKVLVAGGVGQIGNTNDYLLSTELYDPNTETWTATGSMANKRSGHTATLLLNGKVLVAGGFWCAAVPSILGKNLCFTMPYAELYDPTTGIWTQTSSMAYQRQGHSATLLLNGKVLVAGLSYPFGPNTAELYDSVSAKWSVTGPSNATPVFHSATFLPNGKVLRAGGANSGGGGGATDNASLYDPNGATSTATGLMTANRTQAAATLLPDGRVLVVGGYGSDNTTILATAEIYDSASGTWTATASLNISRTVRTATLLPNGTVLVAGGSNGSSALSSAELYDATAWTPTPIVLSYMTKQPGGAFQFDFAANPNGTNIALTTTNGMLPVTNWTSLGKVGEIEPGLYALTDPQATNNRQRFYVVRTSGTNGAAAGVKVKE